MKKPANYDTTQVYDGNFDRLAPGGYICRVKGAMEEDYNGSPRLAIAFDIVEGDCAGYYGKRHERFGGDWPGVYRQFVELPDGTCSPFFKGLITAIEESNLGYAFDWNEQTLIGKFFGAVFGEEEYLNQKGEVKTIVRCQQIRSVPVIRSGDYQLPAKRELRARTAPTSSKLDGFETVSPDDIPF